MIGFEKKLMLKGIEKKKSKTGDDYSMLIVEGDDGRTIDLFHKGIVTLEVNKFYLFQLAYRAASGKTWLAIEGIK